MVERLDSWPSVPLPNIQQQAKDGKSAPTSEAEKVTDQMNRSCHTSRPISIAYAALNVLKLYDRFLALTVQGKEPNRVEIARNIKTD